MKKLDQRELPLVLLEDLGTQYISNKSKTRKRFGIFICPVCENPFKTLVPNVKNGRTSKCRSCATSIAQKTHGESNKTRLNRIWKGMRQRCNNSSSKRFSDYGGRGITVCKEWDDYPKFKAWALDNGYSDKLSIDRINSDLGYSPENCRWETDTVQARNTSVQNRTTYKGVYFRADTGKWRVGIGVDYKMIWLGQYNSEIEAAKVYNQYIIANNLEHTLNIIKETMKNE